MRSKQFMAPQTNVASTCEVQHDIMISVFPNGSDSEIVSADTLREALVEELDMIE